MVGKIEREGELDHFKINTSADLLKVIELLQVIALAENLFSFFRIMALVVLSCL